MIIELGEIAEVFRVRETVPIKTAIMTRANIELRNAAIFICVFDFKVKQASVNRSTGDNTRK